MRNRPNQEMQEITMEDLLSLFMLQGLQAPNDRHTPQLSASEYIELTLEHAELEKKSEEITLAFEKTSNLEYLMLLNVLMSADKEMHHQFDFHSQEAEERLTEVMTNGSIATEIMLANRVAGRDTLARNYATTGIFARPASPLRSSSPSLSTSGSSSELDLDASTEESSSSLRM